MQQTDQNLSVVHVPIDDLRPDPANPRRISDAELDSLTRSSAGSASSIRSSHGLRTSPSSAATSGCSPRVASASPPCL